MNLTVSYKYCPVVTFFPEVLPSHHSNITSTIDPYTHSELYCSHSHQSGTHLRTSSSPLAE